MFALGAFFFLFFGGLGFQHPFLLLFWRIRGFDRYTIGLLMAVASLAGALASPLAGWLSDRLRLRKPFVIFGGLIAAIGIAALPYTASAWSMGAMYALAWVGFTISQMAVATLIVENSDPLKGGATFGALRAWGTAGYILALLTATILRGNGLSGYPVWMFVAAPTAYALCAMSGFIAPRHHFADVKRPSLAEAKKLLAYKPFAFYLIAYCLFFGALNTGTTFLSLNLAEMLKSRQYTPPHVQQLVALAYLISASCELVLMRYWGAVMDRVGARKTLMIGYAILPLRLLGYAMFPFPIAVYALQAFHGFTFNIVTACSPVYAASLAPENLRASAQGTLASAQGFAQAIVPLIGGFVCQRYGWGSLYGFLAGLALLGLIMFLASDGDRIARKEALTANALFRN